MATRDMKQLRSLLTRRATTNKSFPNKRCCPHIKSWPIDMAIRRIRWFRLQRNTLSLQSFAKLLRTATREPRRRLALPGIAASSVRLLLMSACYFAMRSDVAWEL